MPQITLTREFEDALDDYYYTRQTSRQHGKVGIGRNSATAECGRQIYWAVQTLIDRHLDGDFLPMTENGFPIRGIILE